MHIQGTMDAHQNNVHQPKQPPLVGHKTQNYEPQHTRQGHEDVDQDTF